jgi:hypothetical protein
MSKRPAYREKQCGTGARHDTEKRAVLEQHELRPMYISASGIRPTFEWFDRAVEERTRT